MSNNPTLKLFRRKPLDEITSVPKDIISVYVVEQHIWSNQGSEEERLLARKMRIPEPRTVEEFLIEPVRSFLVDFFRQLSAPYDRARKDLPIGQGYWIQAEFGSGKSHLLSFLGALALGGEKEWQLVQEKEAKAGKGKRENLYFFYENGFEKKAKSSKGILVAVKTLVGQGGGGIGISGAGISLTEYVLNAVAEQFFLENDRSLPLYPTEILAERFLKEDFERYRIDLAKFLKDATYFDEEQQWELDEFLNNLQNNTNPGVQRDCGQRLWDFYDRYLEIRPKIPLETEEVLKHLVLRLLDEGYIGLLLILDEVSLFMKGRSDAERVEDEKALVVLSNRLAKVENLPVWTVCAAQQAIETTLVGVKNIIADERLKLVPLLNKADYYYDIALNRVREITDKTAIDQYYEDYKRSFSWPQAIGQDQFARFFPFYPPAIDVVRAVSYNLTTVRSALYFMLETIKSQRKRHSDELISLWALFDDVVNYEEDPSGTTRGIASIKTKFPEEWKAYEESKRQIDSALSGPLKVFRSRCEKIVKTLFLYHIANLSPDGLTHEELMNGVMEWKDHDKDRVADFQDNYDHYELLAEKLDIELIQVEKVGGKYRFNPTGGGPDPHEIFQKARSEAEGNEALRRDAWHQLLALDGWYISTSLMSLDLAHGIQSVFRSIAPESQQDLTIHWHGREISGRVYMRNLADIARRNALLPSINSPDTGLDFAVFIGSTSGCDELDGLVKAKEDPRVLFWTPDQLTSSELNLLIDFAAYRKIVAEAAGQETENARSILDWVQGRLREQMGGIYRIVPDSFSRGRITAADHSNLTFTCQGELSSILTPLVTQILDTVYESRELIFDAPAPFNDTNAMNAINGIVKLGEYERGARPTKELSASQNYGFALGIMQRPNDRKLDLSQCRYTRDIANWIEEKLADSGAGMPATTLYKNFMGAGGPGGLHNGLSKRLVQLFMLCLVREGWLRITLSGRNLPADVIDYSNIASIDFNTALLDGFDQVQRLKPPEGWEVLAPFAAAMMGDPALCNLHEDAEIQAGVLGLLKFKEEQVKPVQELRTALADLFQELSQLNPMDERMAAWEKFLKSPVEVTDPIPFLRLALEKAFSYPIYQKDDIDPTDVDDLTIRRVELDQIRKFLSHNDRIRAGQRYALLVATGKDKYPTQDPTLFSIYEKLDLVKERMSALAELMGNEARLLSELLDPAAEIIQSYSVRYLQAFDQVVSHTEQTRQRILELSNKPEFLTLARLSSVQQLGASKMQFLQERINDSAASDMLFPANLTRSMIEQQLNHWPQPSGCPLTLENAAAFIQTADAHYAEADQALHAALLEKAALLHSEAVRSRLEQGRNEAFISELLAAPDPQGVENVLVQRIGQAPEEVSNANIEKLIRYLHHIQVRKVNLSDFQPSKRTIEMSDVDQITQEFHHFLLEALQPGSEDEFPVVEIE